MVIYYIRIKAYISNSFCIPSGSIVKVLVPLHCLIIRFNSNFNEIIILGY